jgi:UDP-N-acetylglucosamine pyrophosphorylase
VNLIGIDNVLAKPCDPFLIGYSQQQDQDLCCKYVTKINAEEKMGVCVLQDSKPSIVGTIYLLFLEYTEMD